MLFVTVKRFFSFKKRFYYYKNNDLRRLKKIFFKFSFFSLNKFFLNFFSTGQIIINIFYEMNWSFNFNCFFLDYLRAINNYVYNLFYQKKNLSFLNYTFGQSELLLNSWNNIAFIPNSCYSFFFKSDVLPFLFNLDFDEFFTEKINLLKNPADLDLVYKRLKWGRYFFKLKKYVSKQKLIELKKKFIVKLYKEDYLLFNNIKFNKNFNFLDKFYLALNDNVLELINFWMLIHYLIFSMYKISYIFFFEFIEFNESFTNIEKNGFDFEFELKIISSIDFLFEDIECIDWFWSRLKSILEENISCLSEDFPIYFIITGDDDEDSSNSLFYLKNFYLLSKGLELFEFFNFNAWNIEKTFMFYNYICLIEITINTIDFGFCNGFKKIWKIYFSFIFYFEKFLKNLFLQRWAFFKIFSLDCNESLNFVKNYIVEEVHMPLLKLHLTFVWTEYERKFFLFKRWDILHKIFFYLNLEDFLFKFFFSKAFFLLGNFFYNFNVAFDNLILSNNDLYSFYKFNIYIFFINLKKKLIKKKSNFVFFIKLLRATFRFKIKKFIISLIHFS